MAVSIAGVFLASARPSELAYRHTRRADFAKRQALELTNVTRAIVWRCSRIKVLIGVVWTVFMYGLYEGYFKKQSHPCSAIAWIVWWFFAIIATLCLVIWTLLDLRAPKPARR